MGLQEEVRKMQELVMKECDPDKIPIGELGSSPDHPYTHMPEDVPYGAWFKCCKCGIFARSTITFDCFAEEVGGTLECELCIRGVE